MNKHTISLWLEKEHADGSWECLGPYGTAPRSPTVELDAATLYAFTGFYDEKSGAPKPNNPTYFGTCPFPNDATPDVCANYASTLTTHPNHWRLSIFEQPDYQPPWLKCEQPDLMVLLENTPLAPIIQRALAQGPAQRLRFIWWVVL